MDENRLDEKRLDEKWVYHTPQFRLEGIDESLAVNNQALVLASLVVAAVLQLLADVVDLVPRFVISGGIN